MAISLSVKGKRYRCAPIVGCHNYFVSDCGQVICTGRGRITNRKLIARNEPFLLPQSVSHTGLTFVTLLSQAGSRRRFFVHSLVANSFYRLATKPLTGRFRASVRHRDGDRSNNRLGNLELLHESIGG